MTDFRTQTETTPSQRALTKAKGGEAGSRKTKVELATKEDEREKQRRIAHLVNFGRIHLRAVTVSLQGAISVRRWLVAGPGNQPIDVCIDLLVAISIIARGVALMLMAMLSVMSSSDADHGEGLPLSAGHMLSEKGCDDDIFWCRYVDKIE